MLTPIRTLIAHRARALKDDSGATAIEFALISPLLIVVMLAGTEVTQAVMAGRKVATAARTMADLTSQIKSATAVTAAEIDEIYAAGQLILAPYPGDTLKVTISRVDVIGNDNSPDARLTWTTTRNGGTPRPCAVLNRIANTAPPAPDSFPAGMHYAGRFIVVDVDYTFAAPLTRNFAPSSLGFSGWQSTANGIEIRRTSYMQVRMDAAPIMIGPEACRLPGRQPPRR